MTGLVESLDTIAAMPKLSNNDDERRDDNYKCSDLSGNCALHQSADERRLVAFDATFFSKPDPRNRRDTRFRSVPRKPGIAKED